MDSSANKLKQGVTPKPSFLQKYRPNKIWHFQILFVVCLYTFVHFIDKYHYEPQQAEQYKEQFGGIQSILTPDMAEWSSTGLSVEEINAWRFLKPGEEKDFEKLKVSKWYAERWVSKAFGGVLAGGANKNLHAGGTLRDWIKNGVTPAEGHIREYKAFLITEEKRRRKYLAEGPSKRKGPVDCVSTKYSLEQDLVDLGAASIMLNRNISYDIDLASSNARLARESLDLLESDPNCVSNIGQAIMNDYRTKVHRYEVVFIVMK